MEQNDNKGFNQQRFSVDSIIFDIEENSKRTSIHTNTANTLPPCINHARLDDNRLPSVNSDVFLEPPKDMSLLFKIYWMIGAIALNLSTIVVLIYWCFLFPNQNNDVTLLNWYLRIDRHAVVFLLIVFDHVVSKTPIRFLHFIYPSIIFLFYGVFNYAYVKVTGEMIYSLLDFDKQLIKSVIGVLAACFVTIPLVQLVLYWTIYRLRERAFR